MCLSVLHCGRWHIIARRGRHRRRAGQAEQAERRTACQIWAQPHSATGTDKETSRTAAACWPGGCPFDHANPAGRFFASGMRRARRRGSTASLSEMWLVRTLSAPQPRISLLQTPRRGDGNRGVGRTLVDTPVPSSAQLSRGNPTHRLPRLRLFTHCPRSSPPIHAQVTEYAFR